VYGAVRAQTGGAGPKHRWVGSLGHPSEDDTGLVYMRARYYDPVLGRFASEDPAADGANWFTYAETRPTTLVDARGEAPVDWTRWHTERIEWRHAIKFSPQFRLVALAFLALWQQLLSSSGGMNWQVGAGYGQLASDFVELHRQPGAVTQQEQLRAFWAGYSAGIEITMMFLGLDHNPWQKGSPFDP
jgi:RHS repeat-associated protein